MDSGLTQAADSSTAADAMSATGTGDTCPAVSITDIVYEYPERRVLDRVSLDIPTGCIFGFLGPNGSGKTTLFSILATLRTPSSGSGRVFDFDLVRDKAEVRKNLGVAFQKPAIDVHLTCVENLHHHGRLYSMSRADIHNRTASLLDRFGLAGHRSQKAKTLSGGLVRRLELAKAMLPAPRLLLLDEPATGLDPRARFQMWDDFERLRTDFGVTVVLTTHLMEEADRCDRLAILNLGRVVLQGAPEALKAGIGSEIVYIETASPDKLARDIQDRFAMRSTEVGGALRLEERDAHKRVPDLLEAFPGVMSSIRVAKPTLADVFLQATGSAFAKDLPRG